MKDDKIHEECGIFGISGSTAEAAHSTYTALTALQHRGQEGAGIAVLKDHALLYHKNIGLVSEVFSAEVLKKLPHARYAIGHVRYSTTGANSRENTQPIITEYLKGRIATAHNGNITNAAALKQRLLDFGCEFKATNDSEIISSLIACEALQGGEIEDAVKRAANQLEGAFSLLVLHSSGKLIAVRDGSGFRPLCIGRNESGVAFASESCALDCTGFAFVRDVEPGEMVVITPEGELHSEMILTGRKKGACIFEYVYFARTDSVIDGLSVYEARTRMGHVLAREYPLDADIVCGVPDSGLEAARGYAAASGIPCVTGFVKNRYIGRSFIVPTQSQREATLRLKLNPLRCNVEGKRVIVIDDSIVRGTTSGRIVKMLRLAGAKEVHMLISSPPFRHTCHFGTDIDSEENLLANHVTVDEMCRSIGADTLGFISVAGLLEACKSGRVPFCTGCFDANYPVRIGDHTKAQFEQEEI